MQYDFNKLVCFFLDVPNAKIYTKSNVYYGSQTQIVCEVSSCPSLDGTTWEKSVDGQVFRCIDISNPKYDGSSNDIKNPLLVIPKVSFEDTQFYQLVVWNKIGKSASNKVHIQVTGSMYQCSIISFYFKDKCSFLSAFIKKRCLDISNNH